MTQVETSVAHDSQPEVTINRESAVKDSAESHLDMVLQGQKYLSVIPIDTPDYEEDEGIVSHLRNYDFI